jgi:hypothetical protein
MVEMVEIKTVEIGMIIKAKLVVTLADHKHQQRYI